MSSARPTGGRAVRRHCRRRRIRVLDTPWGDVHDKAMKTGTSLGPSPLGWAALALATIGGTVCALAQGPSLIGQWRWNQTESTRVADNPSPRVVVLAITVADPTHVQWTLSGTDAKGKQHVQTYDGPGDGKLAPVRGGPDGTMAAFAVNGSAMTITYTDRSGAVREQTSCAVVPGGNRMICQGNLLDGAGHAIAFRDIYDRR